MTGRPSDVHDAERTSGGRTIVAMSGKAMLAHRPAESIANLYPCEREPFERLTPRTHTTLASLRSDFARIVHADTGELGRLLCRHAAELSAALDSDTGPARARSG
jgi:hypothetical protein